MSRPVSPSFHARLSRMELFGIRGVPSRNKSRVGNFGDKLYCFNEQRIHKSCKLPSSSNSQDKMTTMHALLLPSAYILLQSINSNLSILSFIDGLLSGLLSLVFCLRKKKSSQHFGMATNYYHHKP